MPRTYLHVVHMSMRDGAGSQFLAPLARALTNSGDFALHPEAVDHA